MALGLIAGLAGSVIKKAAGRAARYVTKKALGSSSGRAATAAAGGIVTGAAAGAVTKAAAGIINPSGTRGLTGGGQGFGIDLNPFGTNQRTGAFFGFGGRKKYRRMNYLNQRALKKSIKRVQGFEKIVREAFTISKGSMQLKRGRSCR